MIQHEKFILQMEIISQLILIYEKNYSIIDHIAPSLGTTLGLLSNNACYGTGCLFERFIFTFTWPGLPTNTIKSISMFTGQCGCVWARRANQRGNADKEKSKAELHQSNHVPIHAQQISWRQFDCNGLVDEIPNPVLLLFFFLIETHSHPPSYIHIYLFLLYLLPLLHFLGFAILHGRSRQGWWGLYSPATVSQH